MTKALSRDEILQAQDLRVEKVEVPEWGGHVFIRSMSGHDRDAYEAWATSEGKTAKNIRGKLCALRIVDEAGNKLFTEADIEALGNKSAAAIERVMNALMKMNALSAEDLGELEKN